LHKSNSDNHTNMGKPMRIRAKAQGDLVEVKVLVSHVMETGLRKDQEGGLVPAHFIQLFTVACAGRIVLSGQWGPGVSANPFLSFKFRGGHAGETLKVSWIDNRGDGRSDEAVIS